MHFLPPPEPPQAVTIQIDVRPWMAPHYIIHPDQILPPTRRPIRIGDSSDPDVIDLSGLNSRVILRFTLLQGVTGKIYSFPDDIRQAVSTYPNINARPKPWVASDGEFINVIHNGPYEIDICYANDKKTSPISVFSLYPLDPGHVEIDPQIKNGSTTMMYITPWCTVPLSYSIFREPPGYIHKHKHKHHSSGK